jgi:hypothetical protein
MFMALSTVAWIREGCFVTRDFDTLFTKRSTSPQNCAAEAAEKIRAACAMSQRRWERYLEILFHVESILFIGVVTNFAIDLSAQNIKREVVSYV